MILPSTLLIFPFFTGSIKRKSNNEDPSIQGTSMWITSFTVSIGLITEVTPRTVTIFIILEPMIFPMDISFSFLNLQQTK